jgi:hypothetical protein
VLGIHLHVPRPPGVKGKKAGLMISTSFVPSVEHLLATASVMPEMLICAVCEDQEYTKYLNADGADYDGFLPEGHLPVAYVSLFSSSNVVFISEATDVFRAPWEDDKDSL